MLPAITNTCISCWWGWLLLRTKWWGAFAATTDIEKEAFSKVFRHEPINQWIQTTENKTRINRFNLHAIMFRKLTSNTITYVLKFLPVEISHQAKSSLEMFVFIMKLFWNMPPAFLRYRFCKRVQNIEHEKWCPTYDVEKNDWYEHFDYL